MRILVMSDTHGNGYALQEALRAHPEAQTVLHLGDGAREAVDAAALFTDRSFYMVRGNCDFGASDLPVARLEIFGGKRLFFTHGHTYDAKAGLYRLDLAARERQADILLFGHTHRPFSGYEDGLYMLNPGSLGRDGCYALLDVLPGGIMPILQKLR